MAVQWCALMLFLSSCGLYLSNSEIIYIPAASPFIEFRNVEKRESELVWIKGDRGAVVGLFEFANTSSLIFEVLIGAFDNTKMYIKEFKRGNYVKKVETGNRLLRLDPGQFAPFWIKWLDTSVYIRPGTVNNLGPQLQLTSEEDTVSVRYMAFRSGPHLPVQFMFDLSCRKVDITY
ncbi:hypothetical protein SNE40_000213 [Patella caerulea]|uniref:Farnesoic acid O-methyl transferase domain-containing protein n=1 Tax=Patella caerulea TaxID=87958 RepID=A0AAN8Q6Q2_PATCE